MLKVVALVLLGLTLAHEVLGLLNLERVMGLLCCTLSNHLHLYPLQLKKLLLQPQRHFRMIYTRLTSFCNDWSLRLCFEVHQRFMDVLRGTLRNESNLLDRQDRHERDIVET